MSSDATTAVCEPVHPADVDDDDDDDDGDGDANTDDNDITTNDNDDKKPKSTVATAHRKRLCRFPGCERVIKSQGHCQRHGARAKRCRYAGGCDKQAQGTYDGMCKRHWRIIQNQNKPIHEIIPPNSNKIRLSAPPPPSGTSVYELILPNSIAYRPTLQQLRTVTSPHFPTGGGRSVVDTPIISNAVTATTTTTTGNQDATTATVAPVDATTLETTDATATTESAAAGSTLIHFEPIVPPQYDPHHNSTTTTTTLQQLMPLVQYLGDNMHLPAGWHRIHERRTRGVYPVTSLATQLEGWERQLAFFEICLLSGGTPQANFKHFCHAWGRDATFVSRLANFICDRRGESERKKLSRSSDGANSPDKKRLKKTGVVIPRTTTLEIYRKSIADTVTKSEVTEELPVETTNDAVGDLVNCTTAVTTGGITTTTSSDNNNDVTDMVGNDDSIDPFMMDESAEETTAITTIALNEIAQVYLTSFRLQSMGSNVFTSSLANQGPSKPYW